MSEPSDKTPMNLRFDGWKNTEDLIFAKAAPTSKTDAEPVFLSIGSSELCQFVSGEWSLRDKLSNGDIVHVRYLVGFEVSLAAALAAMTKERDKQEAYIASLERTIRAFGDITSS